MTKYKHSRKMLASIVGHYDNLEDFAFDLLATKPSTASSEEKKCKLFCGGHGSGKSTNAICRYIIAISSPTPPKKKIELLTKRSPNGALLTHYKGQQDFYDNEDLGNKLNELIGRVNSLKNK